AGGGSGVAPGARAPPRSPPPRGAPPRHIRSEYEKWATIVAQWRTGRRAPVRLESIISRLSIIERFAISAPIPGQHNVGCGQEPKRILTYKWNVDEYRNQCEPGDDEWNNMYAENIEHRNSRGHACYLPKTFVAVKSFPHSSTITRQNRQPIRFFAQQKAFESQ